MPGILGDKHASGTAIIEDLGEEHVRTGKPILYTSADSVLQIAAHETAYGLDRLLAHCEIARRLVDPLTIGRVIARPFVGTGRADFRRTANRRDYAVPPPEPTLLTRVEAAGGRVIGIGKIGDIFAHTNVTETRKGKDNDGNVDLTLAAMDEAGRAISSSPTSSTSTPISATAATCRATPPAWRPSTGAFPRSRPA